MGKGGREREGEGDEELENEAGNSVVTALERLLRARALPSLEVRQREEEEILLNSCQRGGAPPSSIAV